MANRPSSRIRRVLIERLESRNLLSAGFPLYPRHGFHGFDEGRAFSAPSSNFHHELEFDRGEVAPSIESAAHAAAPSLVILVAPEGHDVGFVPLFFGWHPTQEGDGTAGGYHWAGHDPGHEPTGEPVSPPSPALHQQHPQQSGQQASGSDSDSSQASPTPDPGPTLGQVSGGVGSTVVVVVSPGATPQIQVLTIPAGVKVQPKFVTAEEQVAPVAAQAAPSIESAVPSAVPSLLRAPAVISTGPSLGAAAASALPTMKVTALSAAPRAAIEAPAVAKLAAGVDASAVQAEPSPPKAGELITAMTAASPADTAQLAVAAYGPAASVGAIRIASGWIRSAAVVIGRAFDVAPAVSDAPTGYVTPVAYNFLRINPAMLFNDTVGRIIRESAALSPATASPNHARAWAITGAVVAADAVLVGSWHFNRRRKLRKARNQARWVARRPIAAPR